MPLPYSTCIHELYVKPQFAKLPVILGYIVFLMYIDNFCLKNVKKSARM